MAGNVFMDHRSYGTPVIRGDISDVYIGKYCSIAQGVIFDCGWHHNTKFVSTYPFNRMFPELSELRGHPLSKGDIHIENDVWIGEGAVIMSGVQIGSGAIIGASSVVTHDVLPYQVVAGNPAKHRRMRFPSDQCIALYNIAWWDWPEEKIVENAALIMSQDIEKFIEKHKP